MLVNQRKCAENTFITGRVHYPVKQQRIRIDFLKLTCYCMQLILRNVSTFITNAPPNSGCIYCNCLDL
jgi:hypothetical protein